MGKETVKQYLETVFDERMGRAKQVADTIERSNPSARTDEYLMREFWAMCFDELPDVWAGQLRLYIEKVRK